MVVMYLFSIESSVIEIYQGLLNVTWYNINSPLCMLANATATEVGKWLSAINVLPLSFLDTSQNNDWLRAGRPRGRSSSPSMVKNFLFSMSFRPDLGPTQPPIQWVLGALSLGVEWQGHEADHSPPTSVKVKKLWTYTSAPPCLHGVVLN
jgi:hypothetical protein